MTERKSHCYATCGGGSGVAPLSFFFFFNYLFTWKGKFPSHTLTTTFVTQGRMEDVEGSRSGKRTTSEHLNIKKEDRFDIEDIHVKSHLIGFAYSAHHFHTNTSARSGNSLCDNWKSDFFFSPFFLSPPHLLFLPVWPSAEEILRTIDLS